MEKELNEMLETLEKLNDTLEQLVDVDKIKEDMKKAIKEPCKININNDGVGTHLEVEGKRISLLFTLAQSEKTILNQLKCSDKEFEIIKSIVDGGDSDNE